MHVYFIQAGHKNGAIKIGVADSPLKRLDDLQTGNHQELRLLAFIPCDSRRHAYHLENLIHKKFIKHRIRGEWFSSKVHLKAVIKYIEFKGFEADIVPTKTNNELAIERLQRGKLTEWEIGMLYTVLKDSMVSADFTPVEDILDARKFNLGEHQFS